MESETDARLRGLLGELHQLLEDARDLDASARASLGEAASEIQEALDASEETSSQLAGLRERVERFEGDHPGITEVVRRLVNQLAEMGI